MPFWMLTLIWLEVDRPFLSNATALRVCAPLATCVVSSTQV